MSDTYTKTIITIAVVELIALIVGAVAIGIIAFEFGKTEVTIDERTKLCLVATGEVGSTVTFASPEQSGVLRVMVRPDGGVSILEHCDK